MKLVINETQWKIFEEAGFDMTQFHLDKNLTGYAKQ